MVLGDEHAPHQVLAHLLSDVGGHLAAGTTVTTVAQNSGAVTVQVRDDSPGVAAELQERLFDRLNHCDLSRSPGTGSTGLGLSTADAVTRAHGGRITADGTPGGTTSTVTIPTSAPTSAPSTA
jgi:two-component system, OmpR family, sensor kinase